jgi:hypothetical protein
MTETKPHGGPAFPQYSGQPIPGGGVYYEMSGGMSLRDWFAGQALAGFLANDRFKATAEDKTVALVCFNLADAMLAARGAA